MRKILFIHIPKTAGCSIRNSLKKYIYKRTNHETYRDLINKFGKDVDYFSFVRNPYDRLVSAFFYIKYQKLQEHNFSVDKIRRKRLGLHKNIDFKRFCFSLKENLIKFKHTNKNIDDPILHFRPQYEWLIDDKEKILIRNIFNFERIDDHFKELLKIYNISPNITLCRKNRSFRNKSFKDYYTNEIAKEVFSIYEKDFYLFKYRKTL